MEPFSMKVNSVLPFITVKLHSFLMAIRFRSSEQMVLIFVIDNCYSVCSYLCKDFETDIEQADGSFVVFELHILV
jgi:hypothetical protein